jgi:hypothetical protein
MLSLRGLVVCTVVTFIVVNIAYLFRFRLGIASKLHQEIDHEFEQHDTAVCDDDLNRCNQLQRLRVITIDTPETHDNIRTLIASLHHHNKGMLRTVVYGLNLPLAKVNELLLWDHVDYVDLSYEFVAARKVGGAPEPLQTNYWKPIVIKHSVEGTNIITSNQNRIQKDFIH